MIKNVNIFMGLGNIAGYFSNLKIGFDEIGVSSFHLNVIDHPFTNRNGNGNNLYLIAVRYVYTLKFQSKSLFFKAFFTLIYKILLIPIFIWALIKFDVFIFGFHHSFFKLLDLPILKLFKKKIIFVYLGSDSRPPYMSGIDITIDKRTPIQQVLLSKKIKDKIKHVEKYADFIINNPASGQFHEKDFINWMCIGMPTVISPSEPARLETSGISHVIVHAPTKPETKGSRVFAELIEKYRKEYDIEYIEITNKPHSFVLNQLRKCDFVLDEMYSDIPLAGLSSEAASFKKIAVVSGYYRDFIHADVPEKYLPPSLYCTPDQLEYTFVKLLKDKHSTNLMGKHINEFVTTHWSAKSVANKLLMLINNTYPAEWVYQTLNNRYIFGYGISKHDLKENYLRIYNEFGIEAFQLSHNKHLEMTILNFIHD